MRKIPLLTAGRIEFCRRLVISYEITPLRSWISCTARVASVLLTHTINFSLLRSIGPCPWTSRYGFTRIRPRTHTRLDCIIANRGWPKRSYYCPTDGSCSCESTGLDTRADHLYCHGSIFQEMLRQPSIFSGQPAEVGLIQRIVCDN